MGKYSKLPHDEWYDDETWEMLLQGDGYMEAALGAQNFNPENIASVSLWYVDEGDYGPEHSAAGLFIMEDGTYTVYTGWCDTTGWDCRSDARFTFHETYEDAVRYGLGDEERKWFNIQLKD